MGERPCEESFAEHRKTWGYDPKLEAFVDPFTVFFKRKRYA
jgi:hypothetical protein